MAIPNSPLSIESSMLQNEPQERDFALARITSSINNLIDFHE